MRGLIQQALGDPEEARRLYKQVLQKDPEHILALDHYAALLAVDGESDQAAQLHKKVCALAPGRSKKACPYLCIYIYIYIYTHTHTYIQQICETHTRTRTRAQRFTTDFTTHFTTGDK